MRLPADLVPLCQFLPRQPEPGPKPCSRLFWSLVVSSILVQTCLWVSVGELAAHFAARVGAVSGSMGWPRSSCGSVETTSSPRLAALTIMQVGCLQQVRGSLVCSGISRRWLCVLEAVPGCPSICADAHRERPGPFFNCTTSSGLYLRSWLLLLTKIFVLELFLKSQRRRIAVSPFRPP